MKLADLCATTPANVNAIVNATGKILSTVKLELEFAKLVGREPEQGFIKVSNKPIKTG